MDMSGCMESPASEECRCSKIKTLERRRKRDQQRCLAHSLVGTPNYIAPEVLLRQGKALQDSHILAASFVSNLRAWSALLVHMLVGFLRHMNTSERNYIFFVPRKAVEPSREIMVLFNLHKLVLQTILHACEQ